jgi:hypothetical protein
MLSPSIIALSERRGLLANPSYLRLWFAGGVGNAMRWLELLVAGIFTYDATHSAFLVAVVTVARTLPMLFIGAIAGLVGEALNRKRRNSPSWQEVPPFSAGWRCPGACGFGISRWPASSPASCGPRRWRCAGA